MVLFAGLLKVVFSGLQYLTVTNKVAVDIVDRVHGTGSPEIRLWRPLSAIPVDIVDVVRGTDSSDGSALSSMGLARHVQLF